MNAQCQLLKIWTPKTEIIMNMLTQIVEIMKKKDEEEFGDEGVKVIYNKKQRK